MIKGLAITPPVLGRISIGKVVEKNGKRLPEKDDQFTLRDNHSLADALQHAKTLNQQRQEMGFQQQALDQAAESGFNNAQFEFSEEEIPELLEEFYPNADDDNSAQGQSTSSTNTANNTNHPNPLNNPNNLNAKTANGVLKQKLGQRLQAQSTSPN